MRCACVDIGSNTTRTLVADVEDGRLAEVVCEKAYTRLGRLLLRSGTLPPDAIALLADTVALQVAVARTLGVARLRVVATAAIRAAANADDVRERVSARAGVPVDVLDPLEEARLAFAGATRALDAEGAIAVVDVGGGSTEVAVGTRADGMRWARSVPVGSATLTDAGWAPDRVEHLLDGLRPPPVDVAVAVGGSATSTARLIGGRIDARSAAAALDLLRTGETHGVDDERVRLMPAALALLTAVADRLGCPLTVGDGGVREGVCLELAAFTTGG